MASTSGGDPGGSSGRSLPRYLDPRNEFGAVTTLLLTGKNGGNLPIEPFIIGKSLEDHAGKIESAKSEAKGTRYVLKTRNAAQVEKLLSMSQLYDGTEVEIQLHPTLNTSRCVISSFDLLAKTEQEIELELKNQGVIRARRILKSNKENTPAIILTFNRSIYPEDVKVGVLRVKTRPYYPNPLLCFQCFEYGHPRTSCPNPKLCYNCATEHEERPDCAEEPFCRNCKGTHRSSSRQCEIYKTEVAVIRTKIDLNLSYPDARQRVAAGNGSYAEVTAQPRLDHARLNALSNQLKEKEAEISELKKALQQNQAEEDKLNVIIEQNKQKDDRVRELLEVIRSRDARIEKLEAQQKNMRKFIDSTQNRIRTESQTSEPEPQGNRKKSKRETNRNYTQQPQQHSSGMSPPSKKASKYNRSPIRTRHTTSQPSMDVVDISDSDSRQEEFKSPHPPPDGPTNHQ